MTPHCSANSTITKNIRWTHGASSEVIIFSPPTMRKWYNRLKRYMDLCPARRIRQDIFPSVLTTPMRLACAGIEVKFHDDHNTGKHIGVKFTDGDITINGSKIDRAFTYRQLNNLFEFNRKQGFEQSDPIRQKPKVTVNMHRHKSHLLWRTFWTQPSERLATCSKSGPATILRRKSLSGT